ncbi:MAG: DUF3465 domain-containing protein [Acidobacteriota bacterium]|nr:DUF3465 domain-containing protein [Acidobacteriota bacterium]
MPEPATSRMPRHLATAVFAVLAIALALWWDRGAPQVESPSAEQGAGESLEPGKIDKAFRHRLSAVMVEVAGTVDRTLPDDNDGSRHQRFILRLPSDLTVLVAHNIDLAPRMPLEIGDRVALRGQYEWNERGGVVHWTHHDPENRRPGGWIRHRGREYR